MKNINKLGNQKYFFLGMGSTIISMFLFAFGGSAAFFGILIMAASYVLSEYIEYKGKQKNRNHQNQEL